MIVNKRKSMFDLIRRLLGRGFTVEEIKVIDKNLDNLIDKGKIEFEAGPAKIEHNNPPVEDEKSFLDQFVNTNASKITNLDIDRTASRLKVSAAHIRAIMKVEGGGSSFDNKGRPIILFEPHIFHQRTGGRFSPSNFSYKVWRTRPYPKSYNGRWAQLAEAAKHDMNAALESASWGMFQVMGFHWKHLGYKSALDFALSTVKSEGGQLDAVVAFIEANKLQSNLKKCRKNDPQSCVDFVRAYNGSGYEKNKYHIKFAKAL